jgi:hypothetical protein
VFHSVWVHIGIDVPDKWQAANEVVQNTPGAEGVAAVRYNASCMCFASQVLVIREEDQHISVIWCLRQGV